MDKTELRKILTNKKANLTYSVDILKNIYALNEWNDAQKIATFMPMPHEAQIMPVALEVLLSSKRLFLPWITPKTNDINLTEVQDLKNDLVESHYGILEPKDELKKTTFDPVLDIILIPALGFDLVGNRIGHGKGYYDRLLAKTEGLRCGICFESHLVESVPVDEYDQKMDLIITEKRVIRIS